MPTTSFDQTMNQLELLFRAGCPLIYLVTHEETRALECLGRVVYQVRRASPNKRLFTWDTVKGVVEHGVVLPQEGLGTDVDWLRSPGLDSKTSTGKRNPLDTAWQNLCDSRPNHMSEFADSVIVCFDAHTDLGPGGAKVRLLRKTVAELRKYNNNTDHRYEAQQGGGLRNKTIVIVSPSAAGLSHELERDLIRIRLPLPEEAELLLALRDWITRREMPFEPIVEAGPEESASRQRAPREDEKDTLCRLIAGAGRGLTQDDYQLGLNKIAARGQALGESCVEDMLDLKAQVVGNPALTYTPHVDVHLGGLDVVKAWMQQRREAAVSDEVRRRFQLPPPRGVMLCGVSGGGKSQLAKLIAKVFNLALLRLDVGSLFGMYQGESEQRTRDALEMAEVLAPVVLWIDELDKAFQNVGGGDNGVSARVLGYMLTWLSEKQDTVFVVATANNHKALLEKYPEFGRKGRFDQIFWVNLPRVAQRKEILRIYLGRIRDDPHGLQLALDPAAIREAVDVARAIAPGDVSPLDQLCALLASDDLSGGMTGAEIEYTVTEAKYDVYSRWVDRRSREGKEARPDPLTPQLLVEKFRNAKEQAVFRPATPDGDKHQEAEKDAVNRSWPLINRDPDQPGQVLAGYR